MLASFFLGMNMLAPVPVEQATIDLGPKLVQVASDDAALTPEGALNLLSLGKFVTTPKDAPNLGFLDRPVFFAVALQNHLEKTDFVLNIGYPALDHVQLFVVDEAGIRKPLVSGDHQPFTERYRSHRTINFPLHLPEDGRVVLLFRVQTEGSLQLPLGLHTEAAFGDYMGRDSLWLGCYYGLFLVMILYNLFLYLTLRITSYRSYLCYMVSYLAWHLALNGLFHQYFLPEKPMIHDKLFFLAYVMSWIWSMVFACEFLELKKRLPTVNRWLKGFIYVQVACLGCSVLAPYNVNIQVAVLSGILGPPLMLVAGFRSWRSGYRPARYFLCAWVGFMLGTFIYSLKSAGFLPSNLLIENSAWIGSAVEAVLLSMALGDRLNLIQKERDAANHAVIEGYRKLEHEIIRREELERKSDELGKEIQLATEQLIQADKLATLGQVVAGVAHDIANPSQLIITANAEAGSAVDAIEERLNLLIGPDPESDARDVQLAFGHDITRARSSLIDITTALQRIGAVHSAIRNQARVDVYETDVPVRLLIDECLTILRSKIHALSVRVDCPDHLLLACRRSQIGQVLTNLISNAVDAVMEAAASSPKEEDVAAIIIRAEHDPASGMIAIEVEDCGLGVPEQHMEQIFRPFFTTKSVGIGTGLGLSISKKIVEAHDGQIAVKKARVLKGACFSILLPIRVKRSAA